jgi:hypothetical protein
LALLDKSLTVPFTCMLAKNITLNTGVGTPFFSLGMHHDGSQNACPKDGYIMSPSRGTSGETVWSTCSADVIRKLGCVTIFTLLFAQVYF